MAKQARYAVGQSPSDNVKTKSQKTKLPMVVPFSPNHNQWALWQTKLKMLGISRKYWFLSGAAFLLAVAYWLFFQPPVFVDSFDPQHPVPFWEILAVNLLFYWWVLFPPPLVVLAVGWIMGRWSTKKRVVLN
jgi:hypothetical protein